MTDGEDGQGRGKEDRKVRVYVDKKTGRILRAEEIKNDKRKERPLTEYKSSFTEEVFSGIAAPHVNSGVAVFHAHHPGEWDVAAFPSATLNENLTKLRLPMPVSIFDVVDQAEGNTTVKSSFSNTSLALNAPLRPVAQQQSTGIMCMSITCDFYADQDGINQLVSILETAAGFYEGPNASNRVNFRGIRWGGMLQHDDTQKISTIFTTQGGYVRTVELGQTRDPRTVEETRPGSGLYYEPPFRMFMVFYQHASQATGEWHISLVRMSQR